MSASSSSFSSSSADGPGMRRCAAREARATSGWVPSHRSQAVSRSVSQSVGQSVSQSVSRSVSQSVSQSGSQSVGQSVSQSVGAIPSHPACERQAGNCTSSEPGHLWRWPEQDAVFVVWDCKDAKRLRAREGDARERGRREEGRGGRGSTGRLAAVDLLDDIPEEGKRVKIKTRSPQFWTQRRRKCTNQRKTSRSVTCATRYNTVAQRRGWVETSDRGG